jgi:uncharacterized protein (TIGR03086 family)
MADLRASSGTAPAAGPSTADLAGYGEAALSACRTVLGRITEGDLGRPTPCTEFTVSDLGDHLTRSMVLLAGSAGATLTPSEKQTVQSRVASLAQAALAAWREHGFDGDVAVGSRTLSAPLAYAIVALELVVHGWDLSRALGTDFDASDDTVGWLLDQVPILITPDRRGRGFAEPVSVPDDAPPLDRLIAFTGRQP